MLLVFHCILLSSDILVHLQQSSCKVSSFFLAMNTELNSLSGHVEILNVIKLDFLKSKLLLKLRHLTRFWTWPRFQYELNPVFGKSKPRALITSDRVSRRKNYKEKYIGGGSQKVKFRGKSLWVDALFNTARV